VFVQGPPEFLLWANASSSMKTVDAGATRSSFLSLASIANLAAITAGTRI
jgi:hypothetical protein